MLPGGGINAQPLIGTPAEASTTFGTEMPGNIADALAAWQTANQPATVGGEWALSLPLFSQLDPGGRRPLLALDRPVYRISTPA